MAWCHQALEGRLVSTSTSCPSRTAPTTNQPQPYHHKHLFIFIKQCDTDGTVYIFIYNEQEYPKSCAWDNGDWWF